MKLIVLTLALLASAMWVHALLTPVSERVWGKLDPLYGERKLKHANIQINGSFFSFGTRKTSFIYPEKNETNYHAIDMIRVVDQHNDGKSRLAIVKAGGVGFTFVQLELQTPKRCDSSFLVDIYG